MVSVNIPDSDLVTMWMMLAKILWEKNIVGQNFNYDRDKIRRLGFAIRRIHSVILCSKHSQLTLNSQKGLHFLQVSTPENPSTKMRVCMKGSIRDLLTWMRA